MFIIEPNVLCSDKIFLPNHLMMAISLRRCGLEQQAPLSWDDSNDVKTIVAKFTKLRLKMLPIGKLLTWR